MFGASRSKTVDFSVLRWTETLSQTSLNGWVAKFWVVKKVSVYVLMIVYELKGAEDQTELSARGFKKTEKLISKR